jgi:hypothetical protein
MILPACQPDTAIAPAEPAVEVDAVKKTSIKKAKDRTKVLLKLSRFSLKNHCTYRISIELFA